MSVVLIILAIFPNIFLAYFIYKKDLYETEPRKLLMYSFFFGAIAVIPILGLELLFTESFFSNLLLYSFLGIALIEEGVKFLIVRFYIYNKSDFNEPFDGIVYTVMIGLGFSTVENIMYVINNGVEVAALRMYTAVPMHAACGVLMGYFIGLSKEYKIKDIVNQAEKSDILINAKSIKNKISKFKNKSSVIYSSIGLFIAVLLHGTYNYFLLAGQWQIMTFIALILGIYFSNMAIKKHQENSFFKT
jgi:RsiW-degrading membrane proteinase PrsW (M82 family)